MLGVCRGDIIQIETWVELDGKVGIRSHWLVRDASSRKLLGRAVR
jgi:hypothetical protein